MASASNTANISLPRSQSSAPNQGRLDGQRGARRRGRGRGSFSSNQDVSHGEIRRHDGPRRTQEGSRTAHNTTSRLNAANTNKFESPPRLAPPLDLGDKAGEPRPGTMETQSSAVASDGNDGETELCFICASPVEHYSVAPCNHRTCHICALRMRALYKTKDCTHCRREAQYVVFTNSPLKPFQEFRTVDLVNTDENIGIKYDNADIVEDTILLLRYNCPDPSCDAACHGWPDLHRHVRSVHHKKMCDLCTRNKKVFTHEHELFTDKELEKHMRKGDDNPGAIDQSGFRGHPLCGFCGERFYGDDELYDHCRKRHERCFICDRREGRQPLYFQNYDFLAQHFRKDHFLCPERECLEKRFIVFASEIDLKGHQLQEHGNTLSKDVRRDARVVDISSFDYRSPYQERQGGSSQREARGRGRDPNTEFVPNSSAQPLRRDEQAFQRQLAIQSAQSVAPRVFGGHLTASQPPPQPPQHISRVDEVIHQLGDTRLEDGTADLTSQARRLRHAAVIERASVLLHNDALKISQFRSHISSYRSSSISAPDLINAFFTLFSDTSSSALGSLVRDVADLYEDRAKVEALRTAWNDWRAINQDYPYLPGPSGVSGSSAPLGWAQIISAPSSSGSSTNTKPKSTSRVLKLKSSTAQSSRSSASRNASWGTTSTSSASVFLGLAGSSITGNVSGNANSSRPTPPTSRPASRGPARVALPSSDAFPALPSTTKPSASIFSYGTGAVRRDVGGSSAGNFAWGASGRANNTTGKAAEDKEFSEEAQPKRKGNKGKKQVLIQWG